MRQHHRLGGYLQCEMKSVRWRGTCMCMDVNAIDALAGVLRISN